MTRASDSAGSSWGSFEIDGSRCDVVIQLAQTDRRRFRLGSTVTYRGRTGLEGMNGVPASSIEAIRSVTPADLPATDLASVPTFLRWFVSPYGRHTPAALIHDHVISLDPRIEGVTDQRADRYFRHMLEDLGVRFLRRWLMWTATAFRTRFVGGTALRLTLIVWSLFAMTGMVAITYGAVTASKPLVGLALVAPLPAAALWGRQYGAGLFASYFAVPWLLPPTVFASVVYGVYVGAEYLLGKLLGPARSGSEPIDYQYF